MIVVCKHCEAKIKVADSAFDGRIPTIICPICKKQFKPENDIVLKTEKQTPTMVERVHIFEENMSEVGWLVVHDENTSQQTLSLKAGKQVVGRISEIREKQADLMIETDDDYMSRQHFMINVESAASGGYDYYLSIYKNLNNTLVNAKILNKGDECILRDGDVIQAGITKIVFKTSQKVKSRKEATQIVTSQPRAKTVVVN